MQGARSIKASKGKHFRGKTLFLKTLEMIYWESMLERDLVRWADFDPMVKEIRHQPICIGYSYLGRPYHYFPDYQLGTADNRILIVEVKQKSKVSLEQNRLKFEIARRFCAERRWEFRVYTEESIRPTRYFQPNIKMLRGLGNELTQPSHLRYLYEKLTNEGPCRITSLHRISTELSSGEFYKALYRLIYLHYVHTDIINSNITDWSIVQVGPTGIEGVNLLDDQV